MFLYRRSSIAGRTSALASAIMAGMGEVARLERPGGKNRLPIALVNPSLRSGIRSEKIFDTHLQFSPTHVPVYLGNIGVQVGVAQTLMDPSAAG